MNPKKQHKIIRLAACFITLGMWMWLVHPATHAIEALSHAEKDFHHEGEPGNPADEACMECVLFTLSAFEADISAVSVLLVSERVLLPLFFQVEDSSIPNGFFLRAPPALYV